MSKSARLFGAIIVAAVVLMPSLTSEAHLVMPNSPRYAPQKLTPETATHLVERRLSFYPPAIRLVLGQPMNMYPPDYYSDLVKSGLLRVTSGTFGREPGPSLDLTAKARHDIAIGFFVGADLKNDASALDIPVGDFSLVPGSVVVGIINAGRANVSFSVRLHANQNATKLVRMGPASHWIIHDSQPEVTLSQAGSIAQQTLPLRLCHTTWVVRELVPDRSGSCP